LWCGGTISFTQSVVYLLHRDLSDHHDVDARIKKAFGALREHFFSTRDVSERLKRDHLWWCSGGTAVWVRIVVPHG
jgi:hypothetical protein